MTLMGDPLHRLKNIRRPWYKSLSQPIFPSKPLDPSLLHPSTLLCVRRSDPFLLNIGDAGARTPKQNPSETNERRANQTGSHSIALLGRALWLSSRHPIAQDAANLPTDFVRERR